MNKRFKSIITTTETLKNNDQIINEIYERCTSNEPMNAFELINSLSIAMKLLDEGAKDLDYLASQIKDNTKHIDNLEILKHISMATLLCAPIIWFATLKQADFYSALVLSGIDLATASAIMSVYLNKINTHKKIIEELDNDIMNKTVPHLLKKCEECVQIVLNKMEHMADTDSYSEPKSFIHDFANSTLIDAFGMNDLTICLSLPEEFISEMTSILQKDLNSEETDLNNLFEMAKEKIAYNPFEDPQVLSRIKN